jgi:dihydrofolate synthase/folylpolyglutamate synthase
MAMDYAEAKAWVFGFTDYEFVPLQTAPDAALDLTRLRSLLARLGDPQRHARTIHIAGSKGKGSTASMVAALLKASGARVGLYTSPHLHSPCERIAMNGSQVDEAEFAALATEIRPVVEAENAAQAGSPLTTFELLTALTFVAFRESRCDWQVIEAGLGGRLDATNVLDEKALCIFTPISLEHTAILGPTTAIIAADKAGILRRGCRAVLAPQDGEAETVLRGACADLVVPCQSVSAACAWAATPRGLEGQDCTVTTTLAEYRFFLPLLGRHQVENASTALLGLECLCDAGVSLSPDHAAEALGTVRWPGRLEVLSREPLVLVDGAHNGASARRLAEALSDLMHATAGAMNRTPTTGIRALTIVLGTLADKDLPGIVAALAPVARRAIAVAPDHPRARPPSAIAEAFGVAGIPARTADTVAAGLREAIETARPNEAICVAGSLYVAAEARAEMLGLPVYGP